MKLSEHEYNTITNIVADYKEIDRTLNNIQERLKLLEIEKQDILTKLEITQDVEKEFFLHLEKRYGKGKFDIFSGEYVVEQKHEEII